MPAEENSRLSLYIGGSIQEKAKTEAQVTYCIIHVVSVPSHPVQLNYTCSFPTLPPELRKKKKQQKMKKKKKKNLGAVMLKEM